ncbi:MAG: hypothetical protein JSY10_29210 [Paenibacillus sp.]|nr:hypothetical protein [Paenibacillus sp.]
MANWIHLDSPDAEIRLCSELALKQEIDWACHISLTGLIFPSLPTGSLYNTARVINSAVRSMSFTQVSYIYIYNILYGSS